MRRPALSFLYSQIPKMKLVLKITRNELRNLFYSPVAWFLLIVFLIQCAVVFTSILYPIANAQDIYRENDPNFRNWGELNSFTRILFVDQGAMFSHVLRNLYLFVPLLTMGLISREINSGTIKLLYSSPVSTRQIVLGKYLAVVVYNLLLLLVILLFMITAAMIINSIEVGLLFSAMVGFFLLICAYSAIGLFMSSLTTYQIVSAISTFTIILILTYISGLWQKYDFIRDLTWFLSLLGRTDKMLSGLLTTKDLIYFLAVIFMFVSFTMIRLQSGRESRAWYFSALKYLGVLAITLAVGYISSRPQYTGYWDTTSTQANTIHPRIQEIIKELGPDEPLEVVLYANLLDPGAQRTFPDQRNAYLDYLWEPYVRFKSNIKFSYKYFYDYDPELMGPSLMQRFPNKTVDEIAEKVADLNGVSLSDFMPPQEIRQLINLRPHRYMSVMQLNYKGRSEILRTYPDTEFWPDPGNVGAVFKRLLQARLPKIVFVTGNLERSPEKSGEREYQHIVADITNRFSLVNNGFDVTMISLDWENIPADASILVLADPKQELTAGARAKINKYIDAGGNMFIVGEPGKQSVLNPVLETLGVQMLPGNIVQTSRNEVPNMVTPQLTDAVFEFSDDAVLLSARRMREEKKKDPSLNFFGKDTVTVLMPGVTGLISSFDSRFKVVPLAVTMPRYAWLKAGTLVVDSTAPVFNPDEGDIKDRFNTALALTRKVGAKEQRIVVCADADFASNNRRYQSYFTTSVYSWLDERAFPIYTPKAPYKDNFLDVGGKGAAFLRTLLVWIFPAILLLAGTLLLIRRKRK